MYNCYFYGQNSLNAMNFRVQLFVRRLQKGRIFAGIVHYMLCRKSHRNAPCGMAFRRGKLSDVLPKTSTKANVAQTNGGTKNSPSEEGLLFIDIRLFLKQNTTNALLSLTRGFTVFDTASTPDMPTKSICNVKEWQ